MALMAQKARMRRTSPPLCLSANSEYMMWTQGEEPARYCWAPPHSGQNLAGLGIDFPQFMQNLVPEPAAGGAAGASGVGEAAGLAAFIICCAMVEPAPRPTPMPAAPPPSLAAAMGMDCATWNCV